MRPAGRRRGFTLSLTRKHRPLPKLGEQNPYGLTVTTWFIVSGCR
jgi:hypothetical protein